MLPILLSVLLTGLNLYPSIATGRRGALVPITGFAKWCGCAPIESQKEGQVFGIGCKIFTIAGPVNFIRNIFKLVRLDSIYWGLKWWGMV